MATERIVLSVAVAVAVAVALAAAAVAVFLKKGPTCVSGPRGELP